MNEYFIKIELKSIASSIHISFSKTIIFANHRMNKNLRTIHIEF